MNLAKGKFAVVSEVSKWDITIDQDTIEEGTKLTTTWVPNEGEPEVSSLNDGEYMLEDGRRILVDTDGIVRMIFSKETKQKTPKKDMKDSKLALALNAFKKTLFGEEPEEVKLAEATTTGGMVVCWEGELAIGVSVTEKSEEDEPMALPDGDYELEDGTTFTTKGGLVEVVTPASNEEFNADNFKTDILKDVDEKLAKFADEFTATLVEALFADETFTQTFSAKVKEGTESVRKDVSVLMDGVLDTMTEMSKTKPIQTNNKVDVSTESGKAVAMMANLKKSKQEKFK